MNKIIFIIIFLIISFFNIQFANATTYYYKLDNYCDCLSLKIESSFLVYGLIQGAGECSNNGTNIQVTGQYNSYYGGIVDFTYHNDSSGNLNMWVLFLDYDLIGHYYHNGSKLILTAGYYGTWVNSCANSTMLSIEEPSLFKKLLTHDF